MPLSRRRFLIASGVTGAGALAAGAGVLSWDALHGAAADRPLAAGTGVLVVVTLYGGNDGLNTVIPFQDPAYRQARGDLAPAEPDVHPLADGLALAPALPGLAGLWKEGRLAVVRGVGYPEPDHSHFRSMAIWQTASPRTASTSGWIGRWLDALAAKDGATGGPAGGSTAGPTGGSAGGQAGGADPLRALAIGPTLPPLLVGDHTVGSAVPTGGFAAPSGRLEADLHALYRPDPADSPLAARAAASGADLFTVAGALAPVLADVPERDAGTQGQLDGGDPGAGGGDGGELGAQLDVVARAITAGVPTRVYSVSLGGFDTHAAEDGTHTRLLGQLDAALTRFHRSMAATPRGSAVTTMVYSEFGRRVAANASGGTDHGTAGPVLLLGRPVRGGFFGDQPPLTDLDDGDLRVTTDFRSVYATLLERVLGTEAGTVLGSDESFPRLAFL
ncbi:DUF1501 domain-containing protein [Parafrankia sp. BMG5.11]|uniref:DUF1501 domain-containing protein n=1 Tax=Parafrankia sp. BMG5.11 TaxID=222540 RepID=UPI00103CBAC3|nr:DUF1501 domain-containing protein [Parafrankia sp. BMG5.11]TCJ35802.1 DUF1501 domain-containing protein [Parafrankia sp. BMG5.11]